AIQLSNGTGYTIEHIGRGELPTTKHLFSDRGMIVVHRRLVPLSRVETRKRLKSYFMGEALSYIEINDCDDAARLFHPIEFLKGADLDERSNKQFHTLLSQLNIDDSEGVLLEQFILQLHRKV
ncbi:hypothetical protein, partial [Vibrio agarivorans]